MLKNDWKSGESVNDLNTFEHNKFSLSLAGHSKFLLMLNVKKEHFKNFRKVSELQRQI